MKKSILLLFFMTLGIVPKNHAQNLNAYKYVIVPVEYEFLNEKDQYQLNSMTKFLFEKHGFTAIMEDATFPDDLANEPCAALRAEIVSLSEGLFTLVTKLKVRLKNCKNQMVFESKEGRSRLKKYKFAYQEALRDAFSSVETLKYSYSGKAESLAEKNSAETVPTEKPDTENTDEPLRFVKNDEEYRLEKQGKTFVLKKTEKATPMAFLNETSSGNFIYRSEKINGSAYFDANGNLIVEYFDEQAGKMKKELFEKVQ